MRTAVLANDGHVALFEGDGDTGAQDRSPERIREHCRSVSVADTRRPIRRSEEVIDFLERELGEGRGGRQ